MLISLLQQIDSLVLARSAEMAEKDPNGLILTAVSVAIVFLVLLCLIIAYRLIGAAVKGKDKTTSQEAVCSKNNTPTEKEAAAIAIALNRYMNEEQHDKESYIITIKRR